MQWAMCQSPAMGVELMQLSQVSQADAESDIAQAFSQDLGSEDSSARIATNDGQSHPELNGQEQGAAQPTHDRKRPDPIGEVHSSMYTDIEEPPPCAQPKYSQKKRRRGRGKVVKQSGLGAENCGSTGTPTIYASTPAPQITSGVSSILQYTESTTHSVHTAMATRFGDPFAITNNNGKGSKACGASCDDIIKFLDSGHKDVPSAIIWLIPAATKHALSQTGTRVIQKAIEKINHRENEALIDQFRGSIVELCENPHGNHVVQMMIKVFPPNVLGFILDELHGTAVKVAKNQYGCRVLERILEHFDCSTEPVAELIKELLEDHVDPDHLCRHHFSNFVIQHIFEHANAAPHWKTRIADLITQKAIFAKDGKTRIDNWPYLATHRTASHVVQAAIKFGGPEIKERIFSALWNAKDAQPHVSPVWILGQDSQSLVNVACTKYGQFVIDELWPEDDEMRVFFQDRLPEIAMFPRLEHVKGELDAAKDLVDKVNAEISNANKLLGKIEASLMAANDKIKLSTPQV